ncbi:telethonin-like [Scleropages formosus]|uniref:Telethonin-like n=1 Tax=Scleropages formosus TaxID=113540 RepID=A0A0P7X7U8_SCLFO|nr:telethonin-like [Scleropages formosus]KPP70450.1 telethonin-like [Scleropages formosus]
MNHLSRKDTFYLVNAHCELKENNEEHREYYQSTWLDLVTETRPEHNTTLLESDALRRESYTRAQVAHFLVQRSPQQRIRLGRLGQGMTEHQLPYRNVLPVPIFAPSNVASLKEASRTPTPDELRAAVALERELSSGVCADKTEVSHITRDMPKVVQPRRVEFRASGLISPPGESSHHQQRRY